MSEETVELEDVSVEAETDLVADGAAMTSNAISQTVA